MHFLEQVASQKVLLGIFTRQYLLLFLGHELSSQILGVANQVFTFPATRCPLTCQKQTKTYGWKNYFIHLLC